MIRIVDKNAFYLRMTGKTRIGEYETTLDMNVIDSLIVNFVRRGRIPQTYTIDANNRVQAYNSGILAKGVYGVEFVGYYNGQPWRHFASEVFAIVDSNGDTPDATISDVDVFDATIYMKLSGDGVTAEFVQAMMEEHNADALAHSEIRDGIPAGTADLTNDADFQNSTQVSTAIQTAINNSRINDADASLVEDGGEPDLQAGISGQKLILVGKNLVGPKGETGNGLVSVSEELSQEDGGWNKHTFVDDNGDEHVIHTKNGRQGIQGDSVIVGQGDLPLANALGDSAEKAITQKAVTEAIIDTETASPATNEYKVNYAKDTSTIGGTGGYTTNNYRVSVKLPNGTTKVKVSNITSGYRVGIHQWNANDPTKALTAMSGTLLSDSGWLTAETTVEKLSTANYMVACISKNPYASTTAAQAHDNVTIICYIPKDKFVKLDEKITTNANAIATLNTEVDNIDEKIEGENATDIVDNEDVSQANNWTTYTNNNKGRGRLYIDLRNRKFDSFKVTLQVGSGSNVKAGFGLASTISQASASSDTGWITPGNSTSVTFNSAGNNNFIVINAADSATGNNAASYADFMLYCSFSVEFYYKENGVKQAIEELAGKVEKPQKNIVAATNIKMVAHKGFHLGNIPENSIDAFRMAGYLGYNCIELDVRRTNDSSPNKYVICHNPSINNTFKNKSDYSTISETVYIHSQTLAQLQEDYVMQSVDPRYRRPIPTLEDMLLTCRENNIFPIIEIKSAMTLNMQVVHAKEIYAIAKKMLGEGNFGFTSTEYKYLDGIRSLSDKTPLLYIGDSILNTEYDETSYGQDGVSREHPLNIWNPTYENNNAFTEEAIKQYRTKGMEVGAWTIPVAQFDNMVKAGVSYITTDNVAPNLANMDGKVYDETDMETTGTKSNGIQLTSSQTAKIQGETMEIGLYHISIVAKGSYTITAANLSLAVNDQDYTRHVFQGVIDSKASTITITASGATDIQFFNAKIVKVK